MARRHRLGEYADYPFDENVLVEYQLPVTSSFMTVDEEKRFYGIGREFYLDTGGKLQPSGENDWYYLDTGQLKPPGKEYSNLKPANDNNWFYLDTGRGPSWGKWSTGPSPYYSSYPPQYPYVYKNLEDPQLFLGSIGKHGHHHGGGSRFYNPYPYLYPYPDVVYVAEEEEKKKKKVGTKGILPGHGYIGVVPETAPKWIEGKTFGVQNKYILMGGIGLGIVGLLAFAFRKKR